MAVTVRDVEASDREAWGKLFEGYRAFYEKPDDPAVVEEVWGWLTDPWHEVRGVVAELDGVVVGIGHYRAFARPVVGGAGIWLDDLFTSEAARGHGAATAIIDKVSEIAVDEGANLVRWITAEDNEAARKVYDKIS
ncbi:MAG: GNAT family N-acetyltransferase, partial [Canibacter sp.]